VGLLQWIAPELLPVKASALWQHLARLDAYRRRPDTTPETLTNAVLLGTLLVPRGFTGRRAAPRRAVETPGATSPEEGARREWRDPKATLGILPLARRDIERLGQLLAMQRRLGETQASLRARRALRHRGPFLDALTWLDIHGESPDVVEEWRHLITTSGTAPRDEDAPRPYRRRRRRRGRGPRPPAPLE
jgi:hypothetical protein